MRSTNAAASEPERETAYCGQQEEPGGGKANDGNELSGRKDSHTFMRRNCGCRLQNIESFCGNLRLAPSEDSTLSAHLALIFMLVGRHEQLGHGHLACGGSRASWLRGRRDALLAHRQEACPDPSNRLLRYAKNNPTNVFETLQRSCCFTSARRLWSNCCG